MLSKITILFVKILGIIPFALRRMLGDLSGRLVYLFAPRERAIAELQLRKILRVDNAELITKKMFRFFTTNLWEVFNLAPILNKHDQLIEVQDQGLWNELMQERRPIIALTGHTGNWELLAAYVVARGAKIMTVGRMARGAVLQQILKYLREKYQIQTIWRNSLKDTRKLLEESTQGSIMAVLVDQDIKVKGINSNFFGLNCHTSSSLVELGLKLQAVFVTAFLFQETSGKYKLYLKRLNCEQGLESLIAQYNQVLEELLIIYPEQWVWFHKRWRTIPKAEGGFYTMSSKEYLNFLENLQ